MQVNTPPATPSSNKENLSLPFQDTFHLLRKKETESKFQNHWLNDWDVSPMGDAMPPWGH